MNFVLSSVKERKIMEILLKPTYFTQIPFINSDLSNNLLNEQISTIDS